MKNTIPTAGATVAAILHTINAYIAAHPDTPHDVLFATLETELRAALHLPADQ